MVLDLHSNVCTNVFLASCYLLCGFLFLYLLLLFLTCNSVLRRTQGALEINTVSYFIQRTAYSIESASLIAFCYQILQNKSQFVVNKSSFNCELKVFCSLNRLILSLLQTSPGLSSGHNWFEVEIDIYMSVLDSLRRLKESLGWCSHVHTCVCVWHLGL